MEAAVATLDTLPPPDEELRTRLQDWGLADDPAHHQGTLALWFALTGRIAEAVTLGERVAAGLSESYGEIWLDGAFAPDTLRGLGIAYAHLGRVTEAQAALERHLAHCRAVGDFGQATLTVTMTMRAVILPYLADDLAGRQRVADEGEALVARTLDSWSDAPPRLWAWPLLLLEGRWDELRTLVAGPTSRTEQTSGQRLSGLIPLGYYQGNHGEVRNALRTFLPNGVASDPGEIRVLAAHALLPIAAALAQDTGNSAEAHDWLVASDRYLEWCGDVRGRAEGALGWATYHRTAGDLAQARVHAERALAHATDPRQPLTLLTAHRLLGELDTAAGRHGDAAAHLDAALILANACAAPYERALCLLALAELRSGEGKSDEATTILSDARAILAPLGAAPALARADTILARLVAPPPVASTDALPFGLTAREAEVLRLVAEGLTDSQMAERLFVSRNTVNSHLRAIYGKLGVTSRAAATRLALERGLA